jgi:hypothetical protein
MTGMSLLDVLRGVMLDPAEQAVYEADPDAYLQQHGYEGVDAADLSEAFGLVADTLPVEQAMAAYTGDTPPGGSPLSATMGADTTDFDEPPTVLDDVGVTGGPTGADEPDDGADDAGDASDADDDADGSPFSGEFGAGERADLPDLGTDTGDAPDLSFGLGDDLGGDLAGDLDPTATTDGAADAHVDLDQQDATAMFGDALDLDDGPDLGSDDGPGADVSGIDAADDATDLDDGSILDDAAEYGGPDDLGADTDDNADDLDIGLF